MDINFIEKEYRKKHQKNKTNDQLSLAFADSLTKINFENSDQFIQWTFKKK